MADAKKLRLGDFMERINTSHPAVNGLALNQTTDTVEWIFQADEDATITRLGFYLISITGTSPTFRISLQGVNGANGQPDGTIKGATNNALATFNPTSLGWAANSWHWITLNESASVTRAQKLAIVVDYSSGTIDASNLVTAGTNLGNLYEVNFPYVIHNNNGARAKQAGPPVFGFGSNGTAYGQPLKTGATALTFNQGSTPDEYAIKFTLPSWASTFKVLGARIGIGPGASSTFDMVLYDTDGTTELQSVNIDQDIIVNTTSRQAEYYFDESSLTALTGGSTYRLAFRPATNIDINLRNIEVDAQADWAPWNGGTDFMQSSRTNAGAWTDTNTLRIMGSIILSDITAPAASGGGTKAILPSGLGHMG